MEIVSAVIMIASLVASLAMSGVQYALNIKNQNLRSMIQNLSTQINGALRNKRLSISKLLTLLSNRNQAALANYLSSNPVIAKSLSELQQDSETISDYQNEMANLDNEISMLQNELNTLGYSQSLTGTGGEESKFKRTQDKLIKTQGKYDELAEKVKATNLSTSKVIAPDTSHLDAITQNIIGGMKENA